MADTADEPEILARAGWRNAELVWEQIQEAAIETQLAGDIVEAAALWRGGLEVASEHFEHHDPRLATSKVNAALGARLTKDAEHADTLLREALEIWRGADAWVENLRPDHRARSSMFHLRLAAKHRGGYREIARKRMAEIVAVGTAAIEAHRTGSPDTDDRFRRWRAERPSGFTDERKLLGAVLLIAPNNAGSGDHPSQSA